MTELNFSALINEFLYDPKNPLLFNNGFFIYFFSIFIVLYYFLRNNIVWRKFIFIFFSLYFFYKASGFFVVLVILSAVVDFLISNAIYKQTQKSNKLTLLIISIVFNLGLLVYFKYTNFFIELSNDLFKTNLNLLNIILPVGISFYTFENLSYTIDVYKGEFKPAVKFSDYLLFLSFFPKLVMGPIVRANDFVPQINKPYFINELDFYYGFFLIITGMFKKLIISDYLTLNYVNYIFDDPSRYSGLENLFGVYCYAIVIYCDFSGYSDIAIGIARWLGFRIPSNFLSPYQSKNITEFWRKWHISLSSWLKDYLYIPLGGNRKSNLFSFILTSLMLFGFYALCVNILSTSIIVAGLLTIFLLVLFILPAIISKKKKPLGSQLNLLATMVLGGLWHGPSLNFIIWGSLHGLYLNIHKLWIGFTKNIHIPKWILPTSNILSKVTTFHFVCFSWIFFKCDSLNSANQMIKQIFLNFDLTISMAFFNHYQPVLLMLFGAIILHMIPDEFSIKFIEKYTNKFSLLLCLVIMLLFLFLYGYFKTAESVMPIYLQF